MVEEMEKFWYIGFILLKIVGLAPISWLRNSSARSPFKISTRGTIYNIFFLCFYIVLHLGFIFYDTLVADDVILLTLSNFFIFITFLIVFTMSSNLMLRQRIPVNICEELHEINGLLEARDKNYWRKKMNTKLKSLIIFNMFLCIFFPINNNHHEVMMVLIFVDAVLVSWVIVQYVCIVALMVAMIETINEQFSQVDTVSKMVEETSNNNGSSLNVSDVDLDTILVAFEVLREVFLKLMRTTVVFDGFYSFVMLVCIIKLFFSILVNLFSMINSALKEQRSVAATLFNLVEVLWLSWDIFLLLLITYFGTKLTSEFKETGTVVHDLMHRVRDNKIDEQLQKFSLHLLHIEVKLTAGKMIPVDNTLLVAITGTVMTYLIILLQLR